MDVTLGFSASSIVGIIHSSRMHDFYGSTLIQGAQILYGDTSVRINESLFVKSAKEFFETNEIGHASTFSVRGPSPGSATVNVRNPEPELCDVLSNWLSVLRLCDRVSRIVVLCWHVYHTVLPF